MDNIQDCLNYSIIQLDELFRNASDNNYRLSDIYPYISLNKIDHSLKDKNININIDNLGMMYENTLSSEIKKDYGKFYTKNNDIINLILKDVDVLKGKILEPSCGVGIFVIKIIEKIVTSLKEKKYDAESILNYICENIYANDIDINAVKITEINILYYLSEIIIEAKENNPDFVMKKLNMLNMDFIQKKIINDSFSLIIGNPPFITLYGKRSRNMDEEKRKYYNTFDFVQDKNKNNKFNTSMFFIENGLNSLDDLGTLCYILDISFFELAFKDLRKFIVENYYVHSLIVGLDIFPNVSSGQIILTIKNINKYNKNIKFTDYKNKSYQLIDQSIWNDSDNGYKYIIPLSKIELSIKNKMEKHPKLVDIFPGKSLRTCCALTGRTDDFIVENSNNNDFTIFPYIEGSKGIKQKFGTPIVERYIKYDYDLQLKISNQFKKELDKKGVKNKKRVTLGDKEAYLSNKIFIRQSAKEIIATFCSQPYAANNSIYILTNKKNDEQSEKILKYTCGILNSDLITFYSRINEIIRMKSGQTPQIKISDLKKIPLFFDEKNFDLIIDLVEQLLLNPNNNDLYLELNNIIYKIYNISDKEILYIKNYLKK